MDSHLINLRLQPIPEEVLLHAASDSLQKRLEQSQYRDTQDQRDEDTRMDDDALDTRRSDATVDSSSTSVAIGGRSCDADSDTDGVTNSVSCSVFVSSSSDTVSGNNSRKKTQYPALAPALPDVLQNTITTPQAAASCHVSSTMDDGNAVNILDIMKETKTSNVNVLVEDNQQNNELLYDSEKYAKCDKVKLKDSLDNFSRSSSLKRIKDNNLFISRSNKMSITSCSSNDDINGKSKRCNNLLEDGSDASCDVDHTAVHNSSKRMRLDEKNIQHELDRCQQQASCSHAGRLRLQSCVLNL